MANNPLLFNAALAGAFGGINTSRWLISSDAADYTAGRNSAISFAQAVDAAIPTDQLTSQQDAALLTSICQQVLSGKGETGEPDAAAIAAAYNLVRSSLERDNSGTIRQWATAGTGPTVTNTIVATTMLPAAVIPASAIVFPAAFFNTVGQFVTIEASGRLSTAGGAPGTQTFLFKLGSVIVAQTPAIALNTTLKGAINWNLRWLLALSTVGAAATFRHTAYQVSESFIGGVAPTVAGNGAFNIPNGPPVDGSAFDATVANQFDFQSLTSVAAVGNQNILNVFRILVS